MKEIIQVIWSKYGSFVKFCIVGISNTLISLVVYTICLEFGCHYILGSILGYVVGILNGYILASKFVYRKKMDRHNGIKFIIVYITSLLINLCILSILIERFAVNKLLAQTLITGFNVVYNYALNKIWTFRRKPIESE